MPTMNDPNEELEVLRERIAVCRNNARKALTLAGLKHWNAEFGDAVLNYYKKLNESKKIHFHDKRRSYFGIRETPN